VFGEQFRFDKVPRAPRPPVSMFAKMLSGLSACLENFIEIIEQIGSVSLDVEHPTVYTNKSV
jgi:hypothetical protein